MKPHFTRRHFLAGSALALGGCAVARESSSLELAEGSGDFPFRGGGLHAADTITVHYYRPRTFTARSPILIVVPGAGRNGDSYRDAWIPVADRVGLLVASPSYPESAYGPAAYQMGGILQNLEMGKPQPGSTASSVYFRDEDIRFDVNPRQAEWLFPDFDRLFGELKRATGSKQRRYDAFGHSAGGQVLHRLALLHPNCLARRIVAANGGLYTQPDLDMRLPFGMAGLGVDDASLRRSFALDFTLLLGENDNDPDRGGQHLHTPQLDRFGRDRLSRGRMFFAAAQARARDLSAPLQWKLQTVPGVGHDFRGMTLAAARLLYGEGAAPARGGRAAGRVQGPGMIQA